MRNRPTLKILSALVSAALAAAFYVGCEDEPSSEGLDAYFDQNPYVSDPRFNESALTISPSEATISTVGETVRFVVNGGRAPFIWEVAKSSAGWVQELPEEREAIYSVTVIDDNNVIAVDSDGQAAIGYITRGGYDPIQIIPGEVILFAGGTVQFEVVGGVPPYKNWVSALPALGTIDPNTGLYSGNALIGTNIVSITDSQGAADTATIIHK